MVSPVRHDLLPQRFSFGVGYVGSRCQQLVKPAGGFLKRTPWCIRRRVVSPVPVTPWQIFSDSMHRVKACVADDFGAHSFLTKLIQLRTIYVLKAFDSEMPIALAMIGSFHGRPPRGSHGRVSEPQSYRMEWPPTNNAKRSGAHDERAS